MSTLSNILVIVFMMQLLYMDDIIIVKQDVKLTCKFKQKLSSIFYMKDLGGGAVRKILRISTNYTWLELKKVVFILMIKMY